VTTGKTKWLRLLICLSLLDFSTTGILYFPFRKLRNCEEGGKRGEGGWCGGKRGGKKYFFY